MLPRVGQDEISTRVNELPDDEQTQPTVESLKEIQAVDDEAQNVVLSIQQTITQVINDRDQRRADAIWAVWRAKQHDGRGSEPPTGHDAAVMWNIAELLHQVAGHPTRGGDMKPYTEMASNSKTGKRSVDTKVEQGIADSAKT